MTQKRQEMLPDQGAEGGRCGTESKTASDRTEPRKDFMTQKRQEMLPDQGAERAADAELKMKGENMLEYMFSHSYWGLCAWDLPALAVLAVMMIIFMIHRHKMEKREEAFEEELAEREAEESGATERTC